MSICRIWGYFCKHHPPHSLAKHATQMVAKLVDLAENNLKFRPFFQAPGSPKTTSDCLCQQSIVSIERKNRGLSSIMALSSILLSTTSQSSAQLKTSYNGQRFSSYFFLVTMAFRQKKMEYHVNKAFVLGHIVLALSLCIDWKHLVLPVTSSHLPDVEETDQEHGEKYQTS